MTLSLRYPIRYYDGALKEDTTKNTGGDSGMPPDDFWSNEENTTVYLHDY